MVKLDSSKDVKRWSSEEVIIPYTSPVDNRFHRYFPDFWIEKTDGSQVIIEIKPYAQTLPPKSNGKQSRAFLKEVKTYVVNDAKWKAAERYCAARGWTFEKLTEKDMKGIFL